MAPKNRLDRRLRWEGLRPDGPCPSIVVRECIPYTTPTDVDIGINAALNMLPFDLDYWSSPAMLACQLCGFLISYGTEDRAGIPIGKHRRPAFDPSLPVLTLGAETNFAASNRWAAATACEILISSLISNPPVGFASPWPVLKLQIQFFNISRNLSRARGPLMHNSTRGTGLAREALHRGINIVQPASLANPSNIQGPSIHFAPLCQPTR
ncbi:hypothetical protein B0H13DRAFT_2300767 [Mycena leptocephala]|nr:hypothetical protein B0H13DRAFT_2300767 [Mycena leptocephala]